MFCAQDAFTFFGRRYDSSKLTTENVVSYHSRGSSVGLLYHDSMPTHELYPLLYSSPYYTFHSIMRYIDMLTYGTYI